MSSELRNQFDRKYEERVRKIREAATAATKELDQLPSAGSMARTAFDVEVARIAQEKLHPTQIAAGILMQQNSIKRRRPDHDARP